MFRLHNRLTERAVGKVRQTYSFSLTRCKSQTHYDVLGVQRTATQKEIKAAFFKLSKQLHPDVNKDDPNTKQKFVRLTEAYDVLGKPGSRRQYDATLLERVYPGMNARPTRQQMYQDAKFREAMNRAHMYGDRRFRSRFEEWEDRKYEEEGMRVISREELRKKNIRFVIKLLLVVFIIDAVRIVAFRRYYDSVVKGYQSTSDFMRVKGKPAKERLAQEKT